MHREIILILIDTCHDERNQHATKFPCGHIALSSRSVSGNPFAQLQVNCAGRLSMDSKFAIDKFSSASLRCGTDGRITRLGLRHARRQQHYGNSWKVIIIKREERIDPHATSDAINPHSTWYANHTRQCANETRPYCITNRIVGSRTGCERILNVWDEGSSCQMPRSKVIYEVSVRQSSHAFTKENGRSHLAV